MKTKHHRSPRLYVEAPLEADRTFELDRAQAHYLGNVMRLKHNDMVRVFNGQDGEWLCKITDIGKHRCELSAAEKLRAQAPIPDVHYLFALLKHSRLDYMIQKATELGASSLQPVTTAYTNVTRVKADRMRANAIEAAEQCNLLGVPKVSEPVPFRKLLSDWDQNRHIIFCDENSEVTSPHEALRQLPSGPLAVLIGPEGGFSEDERTQLLNSSFVTAISLGPRVMRADTAGTAVLALVQSVLGDWR